MRRAIAHLKRSDAVMRSLIGSLGACQIRYREPVFETLARSIIFQQLNGRAAARIFDRVAEACGGGSLRPDRVLRVQPERLRQAGLSQRKSESLQDLARRTQNGELDFDALAAMSDDAVIQTLTRVKGVGVWTAQMFLIFALRRPDVLPVADYGLRSAVRKLYALEQLPDAAQMTGIGRPWRPYASYACWYLWRSLDGEAGI